jgi:hypothetical protein
MVSLLLVGWEDTIPDVSRFCTCRRRGNPTSTTSPSFPLSITIKPLK